MSLRRENVPGTIYLLHFDEPLPRDQRGDARHYLGWTEGDLTGRLGDHRVGQGSRIMAAVARRDIPWRLVRTWEKATRNEERALKNRRNALLLCPVCRAAALKRRNATAGARRAVRKELAA